MNKWIKFTVLIWSLYAIGGSFFLSSPFFLKQVNTWNDGHIESPLTLTLFPAVAHSFDLKIHFNDKNVQWVASHPVVTSIFNPVALFQQKLHILWVVGWVDQFQMSFVRETVPEGFPPKVLIPGQKNKKESEGSNRGWNVQMDRVDLTGPDNIWFEQLRISGSSSVEGSFEIEAGKRVQVGPASFQIQSGKIESQGMDLATGIELETEVKLNEFDPNAKNLNDMNFLDSTVHLKASLGRLDCLNVFFKNIPWIESREGVGELTAQVFVERGKIKAGTQANIESKEIHLSVYENEVSGVSHIEWQVDKKNHSLLSVNLKDFVARRPGAQKAHLTGKKLLLQLMDSDPRLSSFYSKPGIKVSLNTGTLPDLSLFREYFPSWGVFKPLSGAATLDIEVEDPIKGPGQGKLVLASNTPFRLEYKDSVIKGKTQIQLNFNLVDLARLKMGFAPSTIAINDVTLSNTSNESLAQWWMQLGVLEGKFRLDTPIYFEGNLKLKMKNARPVLAIYGMHSDPPAILSSVLGYEGLDASGKLSINSLVTEIRDFRAQSKDLSLSGRMRLQQWDSHSVVLAKYGILSVGLEKWDGENRLILHEAESWFKNSREFLPLSPDSESPPFPKQVAE